MDWRWAVAIVVAYVIGSLPFGLFIGLSRGIDIREHGSKNIGATNTGRLLGKRWGMLCFVLDFFKGAAPVVVSGAALGTLGDPAPAQENALPWIAVALACVGGHMFSIFLKFKGGKGVATGFGAMAALWPHVTFPALIALGVWVLVLAATRYISASSCIAALTMPVSLAALRAWDIPSSGGPAGWDPARVIDAWPFLVVTTALAAGVIWKHRGNLTRLRSGTEPKVGGGTTREKTPDRASAVSAE